MQPPCEIMVGEFLPNIRGLVSHELSEKGNSQRRIAVMLGITQARVSFYLDKKKGFFSNELSNKFGVSAQEVQNFVAILSEDVSRSQIDGIFSLYSIWKNLLFSGNVCSIHQKISGVLVECSVCMDLHKPAGGNLVRADSESEDSLILRDLTKATSMLENSGSFPNIMPEVSVNIAMSRMIAKSSRDVAAIPGRINRIHGRAKAFMLPEFGCSKHSSSALLVFKSKLPSIRAVMNFKYDKVMEGALSAIDVVRIVVPSTENAKRRSRQESILLQSKDDDPVITRLQKIVLPQAISNAYCYAVSDHGSEGVEPMTYLFGSSATEIAEVSLKIAHAYKVMLLNEPLPK